MVGPQGCEGSSVAALVFQSLCGSVARQIAGVKEGKNYQMAHRFAAVHGQSVRRELGQQRQLAPTRPPPEVDGHHRALGTFDRPDPGLCGHPSGCRGVSAANSSRPTAVHEKPKHVHFGCGRNGRMILRCIGRVDD